MPIKLVKQKTLELFDCLAGIGKPDQWEEQTPHGIGVRSALSPSTRRDVSVTLIHLST
jgi:hypothetical protein